MVFPHYPQALGLLLAVGTCRKLSISIGVAHLICILLTTLIRYYSRIGSVHYVLCKSVNVVEIWLEWNRSHFPPLQALSLLASWVVSSKIFFPRVSECSFKYLISSACLSITSMILSWSWHPTLSVVWLIIMEDWKSCLRTSGASSLQLKSLRIII